MDGGDTCVFVINNNDRYSHITLNVFQVLPKNQKVGGILLISNQELSKCICDINILHDNLHKKMPQHEISASTAGILCTFMKRVHTINENVDCMI